MLLALPMTMQNHAHDCGEAALRCVLSFYGIKAAVRLATPERGTTPEQLENAMKSIGLRVVSGEMNICDLKHFCDTGRPVLAVVHWPDEEDSHWICIRGVSRGMVYYQDPAEGSRKKPVKEFLNSWYAGGRVGPYKTWAICGHL
jgi:ABC-type bacteriocin/lantibiotic exporter with double-glycine peptidase domain